MGNLPSDRNKMRNKPFLNIGVDYFGLIIVKLSKRTAILDNGTNFVGAEKELEILY